MASGAGTPPDFGELVELVTAAVLEALPRTTGGEAVVPKAQPTGRQVDWLFCSPCGHLSRLVQEMAVLARLGHAQRVAAVPDVELHLRGAPALAEVGAELKVTPVDPVALPGSATELLAGLSGTDLVFVGALGYGQAQDLSQLRDGDPFVQAILSALVADRPVVMVTGDELSGLHAGAPGREGERIWRGLQALGVQRVEVTGLLRPLQTLDPKRDSRNRALGGLLAERDVDEAAALGFRELTVPTGTVITPLARERARTLGLELKRV